MVKKIILLTGIISLLVGCDTRLHHLTMEKTPYYGDELRIDGYYYSEPLYNKYADVTIICIAILYEDGFCIHTSTDIPNNSASLEYLELIENEVLLKDDWLIKAKSIPRDIGVFRINYPDIEIQHWSYRSEVGTNFGYIIDNTTFVIDKVTSDRTGDFEYVWGDLKSLTYKFQEFSPKPDSTNTYVRAIVWE